MTDLKKIEEAAKRQNAALNAAAERIGVLTIEASRLRRLAREGWERARDEALTLDAPEIVRHAASMLKEIGEAL